MLCWLMAFTIVTGLPPQPADLTPQAACEAVIRYAHLAARSKDAGGADFVRFAMERAYPCPIERSPR